MPYFEEKLLDLLPPIYRERDTSGDLQAFLAVPATTLDELKELIDSLPDIWDVDACDPRFLPLLASIVGYRFDSMHDPDTQRREIREIPRVSRDLAPAQVFLQPIASPWSLGLIVFAVTTFIVGAHLAHWYGGPGTGMLLYPFILAIGGVSMLLAGMWMFRARDVLGTVSLSLWGSFWLGYGLYNYMALRGLLPAPIEGVPQLSFFFFALGAVTLSAAIAALAENVGLVATLFSLSLAAILLGLAQVLGIPGLGIAAGYLFILTALAGWYTASALMLESEFGREILPLGKMRPVLEEPGIDEGVGEPGVVRHHRPGLGYHAPAGT